MNKSKNENYLFDFDLDKKNILSKEKQIKTKRRENNVSHETNFKYVYKVSELNNLVKNKLEENFLIVWVEGEISNSKLNFSGHFYFTLKDNLGQIKAVMFDSLYSNLKFLPKDGIEVIVKATLTCFVKAGIYQLNVVYMEPKGKGALLLAFEELKKKLEEEGLFDKSHKKQIPYFLSKVGIITSPTGAAIKDILSVLDRRFSNLCIYIYPSKVQGEDAKYDLVKGIEFFNSWDKKVDVILLGRGGGSIEDLWAFNEEIVARSIYNSNIPIISCVGHEVDYLISDFVADMRAPTPSAAAEMLIKEKQELLNNINYLSMRLFTLMDNFLRINFLKFDKFNFSNIIKLYNKFLNNLYQNFDFVSNSFLFNIDNIINEKIHDYEKIFSRLMLLDPKKILSLGYSVIKDINNKNIDVSKLLVGDDIKIFTEKCVLFCKIISKKIFYKK